MDSSLLFLLSRFMLVLVIVILILKQCHDTMWFLYLMLHSIALVYFSLHLVIPLLSAFFTTLSFHASDSHGQVSSLYIWHFSSEYIWQPFFACIWTSFFCRYLENNYSFCISTFLFLYFFDLPFFFLYFSVILLSIFGHLCSLYIWTSFFFVNLNIIFLCIFGNPSYVYIWTSFFCMYLDILLLWVFRHSSYF